MQIIPTRALPNQVLQVQLGTQPCSIEIQQYAFGLFVTLYVSSTLVIAGVWAQNLNRIVRSAYLGFSGDLAFVDTQGADDPHYSGLGTRWQLVWIEEADVAQAVGG